MTERDRVYLDWAAATPLLPEAKAAMLPYLEEWYGNPSAIHQEGARARVAVETARTDIARVAQVKPEYVTFTSGGTEANNVVIFGLIEALRRAGREFSEMEVITTHIEHPSIERAIERLATLGVRVRYVAVDGEGRVDLNDLTQQLNEHTVLFATAYANSEIGTLQPLHALRKRLRTAEQQYDSRIFLLIDGAQAPLWCSCQLEAVHADFLTLDFSKCQGPKGVGAIIQSKRQKLAPVMYGGGQEAGLRPGTENVAGIVGAAMAFVAAQSSWRERVKRIAQLRDSLIAQLEATALPVVLNGATGDERIANNVNISLLGFDTEFTAVVLDSKGFAVSTKSACSGAGGGESAVVQAISGDTARARATLRLTLGPDTSTTDLEGLLQTLREHGETMRSLTRD